VLGITLFIFGFVKYREYRVLADTPQIPIRSVSMGLSHVAGTSVGGQPLVSPLTQVPCYYFEVKVEKKVKRDNKETWEERTRNGRNSLLPARRNRIHSGQSGKAEYNLPHPSMVNWRPPALLSIGHAHERSTLRSASRPHDDHLRPT